MRINSANMPEQSDGLNIFKNELKNHFSLGGMVLFIK